MLLMGSEITPSTTNHFRIYHLADVVVVYKTRERFGGLSNMASGYPLQVNGVRILTSEALYQACRFPHLPELQQEIIEQRNPVIAKMKGRPHCMDSRGDWDQVRAKIMWWCLRVKLAQNYDRVSRLLLETTGHSIVEQSRKDDYWGAKLSESEEKLLIGHNVLGRMLVALRELLKYETGDTLRTVDPLNVPNFLLLNKPIEVVTAPQARSAT